MSQRMRAAMRRISRPILAFAGSWQRQTPDQNTDANDPIRAARFARVIGSEISRSLDHGQFDRAQRLTQAAERLLHRDATLRREVARVRLATGDAETALALIDRPGVLDARTRLLRIVCWLHLGQINEAQADLMRWCSLSSAPDEAQLLLTLIDQSNDQILQTKTVQPDASRQPSALQALIALSYSGGDTQRASHLAEKLIRQTAPVALPPWLHVMLQSLDVMPALTPQATEEQVNGLAEELIAEQDAIPTLLDAQRYQHNEHVLQLLLASIDQAVHRLADPAGTCAAVAQLCRDLGRKERAEQWIDRGLALHPMSAVLQDMRRQHAADEDKQAVTTTTSDVIATIGPDKEHDEPSTGKAA